MANYRVIVQREHYPDGTPVYTAECSTLHVYDYGPTIDEVLKSISEGIKLTLEYLVEQREEIPVDQEEGFVVMTKVPLPQNAEVAFA